MVINLDKFLIGDNKLTILAGPCAIESQAILDETADTLKQICEKLDINYVFKSSFDKANRSSIKSYRGPGLKKGLEMLHSVKEKYRVPIVTDIHTPEQANIVAEVADILQIPAFLCRQTDLLVAAAKTGKIVNIKKGQFLAPEQMKSIAQKVFDATHSVQMPGSNGDSTGGDRSFVPLLANCAMAAGADVLFFEIHPNPDSALCDGANMLALSDAERVFAKCKEIFEVIRK